MHNKAALLVMAKRPYPGRTKTRLMPTFSAAEAAQLYACFLQDIIVLAQSVPNVTPFIAYTPTNEAAYFREYFPDCALIAQRGETLNERLEDVLSTCWQQGFAMVCAMNSDSPTLPADYLAQAFVALEKEETDVVLGPCEDGGYYLIGWKRPYPRLIRDVTMSTDHVLQDTLTIAKEMNLRVHLLPGWYDVDTAVDVARMEEELGRDTAVALHTRQFLRNLERA